ncbi:PI-PLC X domain-containing protein 3 [Cephus cinctus]|uniref:PI-PLC X domain-containing protein 3 n=1 Tax=Cephus cinctus TaxID=211228 RepID=A0AAJ7C0A5_CEPCN|nr:PI-PLC X domain-containing protein 3 [Cephus cinctus]
MENIDGIMENEEEPILSRNLEFWMSQLPATLKSLPIIHLAIPGSHDTMTYTIEKHDDVGPDVPVFVRFLGRYFSCISKRIIFNWSVTQYENVTQQLNGGIRYLDLRVAWKFNNNIHFLHGLYGAEITKPLEEVAYWLTAHPGEIVILDFQHFYKFQHDHHEILIDKIHSIFKGKICPVFANFNHISLQWLFLEKYQVFVIYRSPIAKNYTNMWSSGMWPNPWPNTFHPDCLINFLNDKLHTKSSDVAFIFQCLLTPDTAYVIKHFWGSLQTDLAAECRNTILPWINQQIPGSGGLNIVITDYVSHNNFQFTKTVIQRNAKFLRRKTENSSTKYIEVKPK